MTRKRAPLAERLKKSLNEGIEFARGDRDLASTIVPAARVYTGKDVAAIRTRRHMSQAQFAKLLAVSVKTLQSWEQGVRKPSGPTARLLQIFDEPEQFRFLLKSEKTTKGIMAGKRMNKRQRGGNLTGREKEAGPA